MQFAALKLIMRFGQGKRNGRATSSYYEVVGAAREESARQEKRSTKELQMKT